MASWKLTIITHTDLDGVGAAAAYIRLGGFVLGSDTRVFFAEPYNLHRVLREASGTERLVIADLGPNADTFQEIVGSLTSITKQSRVEWYDHHRWEAEWVSKLTSLGVRLHIDTSTCATGVVAKYAPDEIGVERDSFVDELARAVCAADLWVWDHPMAARLYRVAERYHGARGDEWRRKMIRGFVEGSLWWPDLDDALQEYLRREFEGFRYALRNLIVSSTKGCRVAVVLRRPGPPSPSIIGNSVLHRLGVDVVAIVKSNGSGMSLRSTRVNVREIAYRLGGGGHPNAAGAPLRTSFLLKLFSRIYPKLKLHHAMHQLRGVIEEMGGCPFVG